MIPVRQNPIQRTAHLSVLMTMHNFQYTIEHRTVLTTIIAQKLSVGGEGGSFTMTQQKRKETREKYLKYCRHTDRLSSTL